MKLALTNFSVRRPWLILLVVAVLTGLFAAQFPKVHFDNDPENMLSEKEYVRIFHNQVKDKFNLYDFVIVGIVNDRHPDGIFNVETLGRIDDLTAQLLSLRRDSEGNPIVTLPERDSRPKTEQRLDLNPAGRWKRMLNTAFQHNPNRLFDDQGESVIISRELISPSVVDNIKQADFGALKLEYLMENPPQTREEALRIRDDAMNNPLFKGTLVAEDEKAICLYIPITKKHYSHNVANLITALTAGWKGNDKVFITGLPVAEDTFGVEMLVQMATSAPLAGLAIFLLMLAFFRRISLIIAPMLVAIISVICTMGLLIGLGFDVHIMSSMIAIFLMPIAVADSVHILSEFFDSYHRYQDKAETLRHVIRHLFMPMLYTSLTTIAGFASLGTTPIPPVQVFGLHVAFGVALAWLLTMTLIPAYVMVAVSEKSLRKMECKIDEQGVICQPTILTRFLEWLGAFTYLRWKAILIVTLFCIALSVYGISKIQVNDNPVKWFTTRHPIRVADDELNLHFGGTYTAYLTLSPTRPQAYDCREKAALFMAEAEKKFAGQLPEETTLFTQKLRNLAQLYGNVNSSDVRKCFIDLVREAEKIDATATESWNNIADTLNYLPVAKVTLEGITQALQKTEQIRDTDRRLFLERLQERHAGKAGDELRDGALAICDEFTHLSFRNFVFDMEAELSAPLFKQPETLRYLERLQAHLAGNEVVGKVSSAVDALKKASYELHYVAPPANAGEEELAEFRTRNLAKFSIPETAAAVGQVFTQLEGMKKKDSLFHMVTRDYAEANLWVQMKSGDNKAMEAVIRDLQTFLQDNPPPRDLKTGWAGLTYLNVVWQDKMVHGMLSALWSSFAVVLVMMMVLFRSPWYGLLSMIPLSVTIAFIYGLIGLVGKDYDMPVAILSSLTLGLSVDFSIHFLERARELQKSQGSWAKGCTQIFKEPAMAISRNAITISIGFTPLLLAPLVPYRTVGFFLATIMAVSWAATLFILPACITPLRKFLFENET